MAVGSGVAVANIYYNQPMLADMARTMGVGTHAIGTVATATQVGYAAGMPLFIPLGDFVQKRRLISLLFLAVAGALIACALAPNLTFLVVASFCVGVTTVIAQIVIPFAAELSEPQQQGRVIGTILSGVLLGILLARTLSGTVSAHLGWRAMYWIAAVMAVVFCVLLLRLLPATDNPTHLTYAAVMHSLWLLLLELPKLRQVCFVAAMFFAAFSAFWTTLIFLLEKSPYHYGSQAAGAFGLVGAVGAAVAPISGSLSDRRGPRFVVRIGIALVLLSFLFFWALGLHVWGLVVGVVLLDAGVQAAQVANQSRVFSLRPEARNRVNTVYMIAYFGGGSLGSFAGAWAWTAYGWSGVCAVGVGCMVLAAIGLALRGPAPDASVAV